MTDEPLPLKCPACGASVEEYGMLCDTCIEENPSDSEYTDEVYDDV